MSAVYRQTIALRRYPTDAGRDASSLSAGSDPDHGACADRNGTDFDTRAIRTKAPAAPRPTQQVAGRIRRIPPGAGAAATLDGWGSALCHARILPDRCAARRQGRLPRGREPTGLGASAACPGGPHPTFLRQTPPSERHQRHHTAIPASASRKQGDALAPMMRHPCVTSASPGAPAAESRQGAAPAAVRTSAKFARTGACPAIRMLGHNVVVFARQWSAWFHAEPVP